MSAIVERAANELQYWADSEEVKRSTTIEIEALLPPALIEYLWDLASHSPDGNATFSLKIGELSGQPVQNITCSRSSGAVDYHRVFGFAPVNCTAAVLRFEDSYLMIMG